MDNRFVWLPGGERGVCAVASDYSGLTQGDLCANGSLYSDSGAGDTN